MPPIIRTDPLTGEQVIIAQARGKRPNAVATSASTQTTAQDEARCPFCEGKEAETPAEVYAVGPEGRPPNSPQWSIRVFPNKFSALSDDGSDDRAPDPTLADTPDARLADAGASGAGPEPNLEIPARGFHEVIVETPSHAMSLADLPAEHLARVIEVFRQRMRVHYADPGVRYVLIFKNEGKAAGASLPHPHTQLMAIPFVPPRVEQAAALHARGIQNGDGCVTCRFIERERKSGERIVVDTGSFIALAPFASRVPYEVAIFPVAHAERFEAEGQDDRGLADCIRVVLRKLRAVGPPAYNLVVRTSPAPGPPAESGASEAPPSSLHWCVEIFPRSTVFAGFELAGGAYINPLAPETAAESLRGA